MTGSYGPYVYLQGAYGYSDFIAKPSFAAGYNGGLASGIGSYWQFNPLTEQSYSRGAGNVPGTAPGNFQDRGG